MANTKGGDPAVVDPVCSKEKTVPAFPSDFFLVARLTTWMIVALHPL